MGKAEESQWAYLSILGHSFLSLLLDIVIIVWYSSAYIGTRKYR